MKLALSSMHGKAHVWSTEVLLSSTLHPNLRRCYFYYFEVTREGRWEEGSAYAAGEELEQINCYISRLGNTTKYMNAAG